jgi:hypothetical protein
VKFIQLCAKAHFVKGLEWQLRKGSELSLHPSKDFTQRFASDPVLSAQLLRISANPL